jgi:hypothetical protein
VAEPPEDRSCCQRQGVQQTCLHDEHQSNLIEQPERHVLGLTQRFPDPRTSGQECRLVLFNHQGGIDRWQIAACKCHIHVHNRSPDSMDNAAGRRCGCRVLFWNAHAFIALRANRAANIISALYAPTQEPALI